MISSTINLKPSSSISNSRSSWFKNVLLFILLAISGNPLFVYATDYINIIIALLLTFVLMAYGKFEFSKKFIWSCVLFIILFSAQAFTTAVSIPADINFMARLSCGYVVVSILGYVFSRVYLKLLFFLFFVYNHLGKP